MKGIVASTAGLAILLDEGIGDTIRVSLTPAPGGDRERGGRGRPAGPPVDGPALVPAAGQRLPGLRPDDLDVLPGDGRADPDLPADRMPEWKETLPGRRGDARRGHGLRRERPGRVEARRHRDLAAGHVRGAGRAGVRRRRAATGRCAARASSTSSSASSRTTSRAVSRHPARRFH